MIWSECEVGGVQSVGGRCESMMYGNTVEPRLTKTPFNEKFKLRRHLTAIFLPVVRQNARVTKSHKYRKIHVNFKFAATEIKKN